MRWPGPDRRGARAPAPDHRVVAAPGPDVRHALFPPAPQFVLERLAEALGGGHASALVSILPWRDAPALGGGVAGADITAATAVEAGAVGGGSALGIFVTTEVTAPALGGGVAGSVVVPVVSLEAAASGSGEAGAAIIPVAVLQAAAAAVGAGSATIIPGALVPASATGGGTAGASVQAAVVLSAPAYGGGTAGAVVVTFRPSGMNKNGTQSVTGTMAQVTSFTPDATGYPGSSQSGHALVANGSKTGATVSARVAWTPGAGGSHTIGLQLKKGGVLIGAVGTYSSTSPATISRTVDVASGDLITVEVRDSGPWASSYTATVTSGTGTYVRIE